DDDGDVKGELVPEELRAPAASEVQLSGVRPLAAGLDAALARDLCPRHLHARDALLVDALARVRGHVEAEVRADEDRDEGAERELAAPLVDDVVEDEPEREERGQALARREHV